MGKFVPTGARDLPSPGPFSQVLVIPAGDLVVISGQGPIGPDGELVGDTIEAQAEYVLESARHLLATAGAGFEDVFKANVYLTNLDEWPRFNDVYRRLVPEPRPARTAVGAALLFGMKVEIDLWASRPQGGS